MKKSFLHVVCVVSMVMLLPGCDWRSWFSHSCSSCGHYETSDYAQDDTSCCISLNGKPVVTQGGFFRKLDDLCQARPDIKQALATLPTEQQQGFYQQFADALLAEVLIGNFVKENNLTHTAEYKQAAQQAHAALETQLMNNIFQSELLKKVEQELTDDIAEAYYNDNRDRIALFKRAPFIDTLGGAHAIGIEGLSLADAKALAVRAEKQDLKNLAQEFRRKVKTYGLITSRSLDVDEHIRSKVLGYSSAPTVDVITLSNGKHAVVKVDKIVQDAYKPYSDPEVAQAVRSFLIRNELGKAVTKAMDELKKKYNAVVHHDVIIASTNGRGDASHDTHVHDGSCSHAPHA